jgi:hypothetical protein
LRPFERLTVDCCSAFVYNQHFSKGNQSSKDPMDRIAGGGTFARDPDTIFTFTNHSEPDCFTVNVIQRSFKPVPPFVVRWQNPILVRDDSLDPEDLEKPKKSSTLSKSKGQTEMIMAALRAAESSGRREIYQVTRSNRDSRYKRPGDF